MESTDKALMLAVRDGDVDKFGLLFDRHHRRLFEFFYRMTGDRTASEDLVQDVFLRMLKYRNSFGQDSQFRAWMYRIARTVRIDRFRKHQNEAPMPVEHFESSREATLSIRLQERVERNQQTATLERALLELPEDKRELIVLARYQEMKYQEIASLLEIEVGAVKVRVHRAIADLRQVFMRMSGEKSNAL
jgi:RNA polymerase sigma factor (sigma-70 family)